MRFKKIMKKENGSITITVLASMLFITTVLVISYFSISSKSSNQNKNVERILKQYSVTDAQIEQKYNQISSELDSRNFIDIDQIKSLSNIMLIKQTNTETIDKDGNKLIIPAGFKLTNEENTDKVEKGLVIEDKNQNQWVWIPVSYEDLLLMYEENTTGWNLVETDVNTKYKSKSSVLSNQVNSTNPINLIRINPGETRVEGSPAFREPDILSGSEYDGSDENRIAAGFVENDEVTANSLETMAQKLRDDYINMIDSIKTHGGFYIGRYEIGKDSNNNPQEKAGAVMNRISWYRLYFACKSFSNEHVESRMIWDCQWDQICRFINQHGDKKNIEDSSSYGNFSGQIQNTGTNSNYIANNIYDIAGNCWEWNQACFSSDKRASRGGGFNKAGDTHPISKRVTGNPATSNPGSQHSSRPILYIK